MWKDAENVKMMCAHRTRGDEAAEIIFFKTFGVRKGHRATRMGNCPPEAGATQGCCHLRRKIAEP
jgi:hypothetical protein